MPMDETEQEMLDFHKRNEKYQRELLQAAAKKSSYGSRLIAKWALMAANGAESDGLTPALRDYEWKYTTQQGLRAAHHARVDAAIVLMSVPTLLDNQKKILFWLRVACCLAAYIAWKLAA